MATKTTTSANRKVTNVECLSIDKQYQNGIKQKMYSLSVQWSDGSKTPAEVSHSSLADFRSRLKNECYGTQPDVNVPEIPAMSLGRLDIGQVVAKRDDKKKKAIQEFLQEIVKLPETPKKTRLLREFFNCQGEATPDASRVVYAEVVRRPELTADSKMDQHHSVGNVILYADLDLPEHRNNGVSSKQGKAPATNGVDSSRNSEVLYAEVIPRMMLESVLAQATDEVTSPVDDVDGNHLTLNDEQAGRLYINVPPSPPRQSYENVILGKKGTAHTGAKQYYRVITKYVPNMAHTPGLPVETGDIVQARQQEGRRVQCILCAKDCIESISGRKIDGWIPLEYLEPCQPHVTEGTESSIPIIMSIEDRSKPPAATPRAKASNNTPTSSSKPKLASPRLQQKMRKPSLPEREEFSQVSDLYMLDSQYTLLKATPPKIPDMPPPSIKSLPGKAALEILAARTIDQLHKSATDVVRAIAIVDFISTPESEVMNFHRGSVGELIYTTEQNWWLVKVGEGFGWVPGEFWQILAEDGRIGSGDTAPWMVGALSRVECEQLLMKNGRQRNFVIRQSTNLTGQFALSIKYNDKLHHFPIVPTADGKFYIGKHHFSSINNVVIYYTKHTLFVDDLGNSVTLGSPLKAV